MRSSRAPKAASSANAACPCKTTPTSSLMVGLDEFTDSGTISSRRWMRNTRAVTLDDIKRVANQYFNNKPHAVVVVTPSEEKE